MYVIAVTGGMGSGKSVASEYFRTRGAVILDLDTISHQLIGKGLPTYDKLIERFGTEILDHEGNIDRGGLATLAFIDDESANALNRIVHPAVLREVAEGVTSLRLMERPPQVVVIEIPLLAEAPVFADIADTVLAISCPTDVRLRRLVEAGVDPLDASRRIARQATDDEREALAEHVIENDTTLEEFLGRLEEYWEEVAPRGT